MKNLFFACGLLAVITMCTPSVMAQNAPTTATPTPGGPMGRQQMTPEQRAGRQTDMMTKQLALTPDEVTKVKQINLDFQTKMDQLRSSNPTPQDRQTQMKALRDQHDAALKGVLTPDQYTKMQQMMQNRGPQRPGAPQGTTPTPPNQN